jgi:hypothetical protein
MNGSLVKGCCAVLIVSREQGIEGIEYIYIFRHEYKCENIAQIYLLSISHCSIDICLSA